jgi:hypothetical protein
MSVEATNGVIRSRKSRTDNAITKRTNNEITKRQSIALKIEQHEPHKKS